MPAVVVAELMYAFRQGQRTEQHVDQLRSFLEQALRLVRAGRAGHRGPLRQDHGVARARGIQVPTNRVWVAAHAMETGADLVSADRCYGHIEQIAWVSVGPD